MVTVDYVYAAVVTAVTYSNNRRLMRSRSPTHSRRVIVSATKYGTQQKENSYTVLHLTAINPSLNSYFDLETREAGIRHVCQVHELHLKCTLY